MAETIPPADPSYLPPASAPVRRSLFWPIILIGIGVVALLFNTGWLDWDRVARLYQLWPVLLIALGVAILFRGRVPARLMSLFGAIIVIVLVIAVGGAVAAIPRAIGAASGPVVTSHYAMATGEVSAPHLDLSAGAAQINVHAGSTGSDLFRATIQAPADEKPEVNIDPTTSTLTINLPGRSGFHWGNFNDHRTVDLTLNDQLPWVVGLSTGASQTTLDLSAAKLTSVTLESGASTLKVSLPKPDATVPVSVSGGAMHLSIQRPAGVPIRVTASGGASSLDVDGSHFGGLFQEGQDFISSDYSNATGRYDISIESGASSIQIS